MVDVVDKYLGAYLNAPFSKETMEKVIDHKAVISMKRNDVDVGVTNKQELITYFSNKDHCDLVENALILQKSILGDDINHINIEMLTKQKHRFGDDVREIKVFDKMLFSIHNGKLITISHNWRPEN